MSEPRVFTIPPGTPFLEALGQALLANAIPGVAIDPKAPFALADTTVFLPNRRACREFARTLVHLRGGQPLLLPKIRPLGDIDPEDSLTDMDIDPEWLANFLSAPPPIDSLERLLSLTRLVQTWCEKTAPKILIRDDDEPVTLPGPPAHAFGLARELARLMDQIQTEGVSLAGLGELHPENQSAYLEITTEFLKIVGDTWPEILDSLERSSPAWFRDLAIREEAARLAAAQPASPMIAAGSTGSIPATAELMKAIASLPQGAVVLPGLDMDCSNETWAEIAETPSHSQHGLARLLRVFDIGREAVAEVSNSRPRPASRARSRLASIAFSPEQATAQWGDKAHMPDKQELEQVEDDLVWVEAATPQEEALVIAARVRTALDDGTTSVAVVTPDRNLARRVQAELKRWDIEVDDSAGLPLSSTPPGNFALLVAEAVASQLAPVPLLSLLKHPLCRLGVDPTWLRREIRLLERHLLRGPRPEAGVAGLRAALAIRANQQRYDGTPVLTPEDAERINALVEMIGAAVADWERVLDGEGDTFSNLLNAHENLCRRFAVNDAGEVSELFDREAGRRLDVLFNRLKSFAPADWPITLGDYPGLFRALASEIRVRDRAPAHPKVQIYGLLEARLIQPDCLVLAGLNEGTWPAEIRTDPWLSRSMREALGLSPPERRIGLAAHDFVQGFATPNLMITRATRVDGDATVPARWLLRIEAILGAGKDANDRLVSKQRGDAWLKIVRSLDQPDAWSPETRPAPTPALDARPRELSVSRVETLIRDPYAIYAERILKLSPLDPIDAGLDARDRGNWIHEIMGAVGVDWPRGDPDEVASIMRAIGAREIKTMAGAPETKAVMMHRFDRAAHWFATENRSLLDDVSRSFPEIDGCLDWEAKGGPFRLKARADRIDLHTDGEISIYDYKTGEPPSEKQETKGFSPQLLLEAAIAMAGGFESEAALKAAIKRLVYIQLSGRAPPGKMKEIAEGNEADEAVAALKNLKTLIDRFDDPDQPYYSRPSPKFSNDYGDFNHLARLGEWDGGETG